MPSPNKGEKQSDFIDRCIPVVIKDGTAKDNKQAYAICQSIWSNKDKKKSSGDAELDDTLPEELKGVKLAIADDVSAGIKESSVASGKPNEEDGMAGAIQSSANQSSTEQEPPNKEKTMADTLSKDDIRKEVEALLTEKNAKAAIEAKIASLEGEKTTLAEQLKAAQNANQTLSTEKESLAGELKTANDSNKALAKEKEELASKVTEHENALKAIREEQALAVRKGELENAKILFAEGEKRTKQLEKVRVMTDEAFASYKAELTEVAELSKKAEGTQAPTTPPPATPPATEGKQEDANGGKAQASVQVADVSDGDKYRQAIAAASESVKLDEDRIAQYAQM